MSYHRSVKPLRVAFSGSSGTGKTTLASAVTTAFHLELNPVGARSVAKEMGFDSPYDVDAAGRRAEFQRRLVSSKIAWEGERKKYVTDRTPFDHLVYTMMHDVRAIDPCILEQAIAHSRQYTHVIFCPMGAHFQPGSDAARVTDNRTYHDLFETALRGFLYRYLSPTNLKCLLLTGRDERLDYVTSYLKAW